MSVQPSDTPRFNAWSGMLKCLTNPTAAFAHLADHPKPPFLLAYLVAGLLPLPFFFITFNLTQSLLEQGAVQSPAPELQSAIMATAMVSGAIGLIFGPMISGLIYTLVAMLAGLFVGGGVGFRRYYSMIAYASLPSAIGSFIQGLLSLNATSLEDVQRVSLGLGVLLPEGSNKVLVALVNTLNPFTLWWLLVGTIGFAALHRTKVARGAVFSGILYAFSLLFAIVGATFSFV